MGEQEMTRQRARRQTGAREEEWGKMRVRENQLGQYFQHAERSQGSRGCLFHDVSVWTHISWASPQINQGHIDLFLTAWRIYGSLQYLMTLKSSDLSGITLVQKALNKIALPFIANEKSYLSTEWPHSQISKAHSPNECNDDNTPLKVIQLFQMCALDISGNWDISRKLKWPSFQ